MANKAIISILVILLVLMGGMGYFFYTLDRHVDQLGERLAAFETEQASRVNAISTELENLRTETQSSLSSLEGKVEGTKAAVDTINKDLTTARERIASVVSEISGVSANMVSLNERITSAETEISGSVINAGDVYEKVSQATVRITNGQSVVGSGFFFDDKGHVVTAQHVISALTQIYIITDNGSVSKATTAGSCQYSDVAVLKVEISNAIKPPSFADSSKVRIGEPVITLGSPGSSSIPLGLKDTLTSGIISQVNRYVDVEGHWVANMLQFDAAANFGNSGCPLANSSGEVIGMVTARIDPNLGDGIYYAVSANKVKRVAEAIIASGSFAYPWIGVGITDLTPQMVQEKSLETINGVLVSDIFSGSPAQAAGIQSGDIITAIDGIPVTDTADLTSYLGEHKSPGDTTVLEILRGTTKIEITVKVGIRTQ
jgi:S1-C subfamily serine protease